MSAPALVAKHLASSRTGRKIVAALLVFLAAVLFAPLLAVMASSGSDGPAPSANAGADIPPNYLIAYQRAAAVTGLDWTIIAAIGKVECDHGRSLLPGCNPVGSINPAGASGPMQFLATTWRANAAPGTSPPLGPPTTSDAQGYASDADGDGLADIWNIDDAALAAARLLRANGAPVDYQHSDLLVQPFRRPTSRASCGSRRATAPMASSRDRMARRGLGARISRHPVRLGRQPREP